MKIAEIYLSRQGEGRLTGTPSVFVRTSGCNLRCWFCDTPYASSKPEGDDLSVEEIGRRSLAFDCQHVVITGGEPMLFAELIPLTAQLRTAGRHITIETAGTLYLPVHCDLMSISPKMSNSAPSVETEPFWRRRHEQTRLAPDVIRRLTSEYEYQLKFVIDAPADCDEVMEYLDDFPDFDRGRVLLMPQGTDAASLAERAAWLEAICAERGFAFCPRRHIEWYGFVRGA
jgi:7-carboxy-7-deazaguanine synthase